MWMPLRAPKMYGFIRGFQRWVWWPKCAPASINCCMVTTGAAIGLSFPVEPLGSWNRAEKARCGTGMVASHVDLPARHDAPKPGMSPAGRAPLTEERRRIQP
jgi:hypothetical protein